MYICLPRRWRLASARIHSQAESCLYLFIYLSIDLFISIYIYRYRYMYVCMYVCTDK